ncbi:MAG: tyrosinase family protein [Chitinophagaceae bacterium]|nr:tyrosinase family protein [Oligoflexus sp.]
MDHSQDRRRFLLSTLGAAGYATPLAGFLLNACKPANHMSIDGSLSAGADLFTGTRTIRRSATAPNNKANVELYRKAVAKMKITPFPILVDGQQLTWWEAHAEIHNNNCPHGNWYFFPWHRAYLHYFELVCRAFCEDSTFALPYWDWTSDSALPEAFTSGDESSNALFNPTRVVKDRTPLNVAEVNQGTIDSLMEISDFTTFAGGPADRPRQIDSSIANEARGFTGRFEGLPHNKVHATIQGDMGAFTSPRDPIFWLHHCNVDRLWTVWVTKRAEKNQDVLPPDPVAGAATARLTRDYFLKSKVFGFYSVVRDGDKFTAATADFTVGEVIDASALGLSYEWIAPSQPAPVEQKPTPPPAPVVTAPTPPAPGVQAPAPVVTGSVPVTPVPVAVIPAPQPVPLPLPNPNPVVSSPLPSVPSPAVIAHTPPNPNPQSNIEAIQEAVRAAIAAQMARAKGGTILTYPSAGASRFLRSRFQMAITRVSLVQKMVSHFSLTGSGPTVISLAGSTKLDAVMLAASKNRGNKEATLRLIVNNIPFPTNPQGELLLYMNVTSAIGESSNPGFIGSFSFFGHKHTDATISAVYDLVPTVKHLVAANRKPYGKSAPILVSAVWKNNPNPDDLSKMTLSLDYLELT